MLSITKKNYNYRVYDAMMRYRFKIGFILNNDIMDLFKRFVAIQMMIKCIRCIYWCSLNTKSNITT